MHSKRSFEGLVTIDHRNSPGVTEPVMQHGGVISEPVGKGQFYESATITCAHCQTIVILNPLRTRPRNYCQKCDAYICDQPGCPREADCLPFAKIVDTIREKAVRHTHNWEIETVTDVPGISVQDCGCGNRRIVRTATKEVLGEVSAGSSSLDNAIFSVNQGG